MDQLNSLKKSFLLNQGDDFLLRIVKIKASLVEVKLNKSKIEIRGETK